MQIFRNINRALFTPFLVNGSSRTSRWEILNWKWYWRVVLEILNWIGGHSTWIVSKTEIELNSIWRFYKTGHPIQIIIKYEPGFDLCNCFLEKFSCCEVYFYHIIMVHHRVALHKLWNSKLGIQSKINILDSYIIIVVIYINI